MLRRDAFRWTKEAEKAFDELKSALCNSPVLALPDFQKAFVVEADASYKGMGAVLGPKGEAPRENWLKASWKEMEDDSFGLILLRKCQKETRTSLGSRNTYTIRHEELRICSGKDGRSSSAYVTSADEEGKRAANPPSSAYVTSAIEEGKKAANPPVKRQGRSSDNPVA
nr:uncharacterized protein LOC109147136 [Ipomoea trifida]